MSAFVVLLGSHLGFYSVHIEPLLCVRSCSSLLLSTHAVFAIYVFVSLAQLLLKIYLIILHSERPTLYTILAFLSAIRLNLVFLQ